MITVEDVRKMRDDLIARGRAGSDVLSGLRAELSGRLQEERPMPTQDMVTDEHRIAADHERAKDPHFTTALHYLQKKHALDIWTEVDRLVAEAGVK